MTLTQQLIGILLLTLALPWAGCQYARELETTLRDTRINALLEIAHSASQQLASQMASHRQMTERTAVALHATELAAPPILDGYADEWQLVPPQRITARTTATDQPPKDVTLRAGVFQDRLYLFFAIPDATRHYYNPTHTNDNGDRLYLTLFKQPDTRARLQINTSAPGAVNITGPATLAKKIHGHWQEHTQGYSIELVMPISMLPPQLQFTYADAQNADSRPAYTDEEYDGTSENQPHQTPLFAMPKGQVILPEPALKKAVQIYARPTRTLCVTTADGWILAQSDTESASEDIPSPYDPTQESLTESISLRQTVDGVLTQLYRLILSDNTARNTQPTGPSQGRFTQPTVAPLLNGQPIGHWQQPRLSEAIITAGAPIFDPNDPKRLLGAVILTQRSEAILSVKNQAITRLFRLSFSAIAVITLALLLFAGILSLRIKRLSSAAQQVLSADGEFSEKVTPSSLRDEIGDLSRSLFTLQSRLGEYTAYLRSL